MVCLLLVTVCWLWPVQFQHVFGASKSPPPVLLAPPVPGEVFAWQPDPNGMNWLAERLLRVEDFGVYWAATVLHLRGENPYDPDLLLIEENKIRSKRESVLMARSPPWALALLYPVASFNFATARFLWLLLTLLGLLVAVLALSELYLVPKTIIPLVCALAVVNFPTIQMIALGQLSIFSLLGTVGFLAWHQRRPLVGGACLALLLVKPQNMLVLLLVGLLWLLDRRQGKVLAGGLLGGALLTALALLPNPSVFSQYHHLMTASPPTVWYPPTPGTLIRLALQTDAIWPAFIPAFLGVGWGVWYYLRHRAAWAWSERAPTLLFATYLCTPYGWVYDQVVFLVPLVAVAAAVGRSTWLSRGLVVLYLGLTVLEFLINRANLGEFPHIWLAPTWLVIYLVAMRWSKVRPSEPRLPPETPLRPVG